MGISRPLAAGLIAALAAVPAAHAGADGADADMIAALELAGGSDVVAFDLPAAPGAARVRAATSVRAAPAAIAAVLLDPARFSAVIPAMVRCEVLPPARGAAVATDGARRIAWELEVPLLNLSGELVLRQVQGGVEMVLTDGDLAPGRVTFRAQARGDGSSALVADVQVDVRRSSFFIRRMMARSALGEPAALAAAAFVALRATALRAEHAREPAAWRPTAPPAPPVAWLPDAKVLADPRLAALRARGALALVARGPGDRLAGVAVARDVPLAAAVVAGRLRDPSSWHNFPGWKKVEVGRPAAAGAPPSATVEDGIAFVDLDAAWQGLPGAGARWVAIAGATRGARLGWTVAAAGASASASVAVLSLYPRLEQTGTIARRFIAAEPLLEHGLALSLAFVDAMGATAAALLLAGKAAPQQVP